MYFYGFFSIITGLYLLTEVFHASYTWYLAGIFLFVMGLFIIIDKLACIIEEKSIEYHSSPDKKGPALYAIKENTAKSLILESTLKKGSYFIIIELFIIAFFVISTSYLFYYFRTADFYWLFLSISTLLVGLFFWIIAKRMVKSKGEYIILDKKNKEMLIKSPVQRDTQNLSFKHLKRIIVRTVSVRENKKKSIYFDKVYQVIFELKNGKKKIIERSQDSIYIQELVRKLRDTIRIEIVDLASLDLQVKASSYKAEDNKSFPMWTHLEYSKIGEKESFRWKARESIASLYLELFFILINVMIKLYIYLSIPMPKMLDLLLLFSGLFVIQITFFIRNHFGYENFTFTDDGVNYQYKLAFLVLKEKSLKTNEVKNAFVLFDDAVLEGENHYLIGNISILSPVEKQWLKNKWNRLLQIPTSNELEQNFVRFS